MPSPGKAQLDPDLKIFRDLVQSGVRPTQAYQRVYAATRKISPQACRQGGIRKMSQCNLLNPIRRCNNATVQPVAKPIFKGMPEVIDNKDFTSPRKLLLKRLWDAVNSDSNPEAIAAVKQLRDWLREDEQRAEAASVSDPAIVARHCAATLTDYTGMDAIQRQDYIARVLSTLESIGLPRADLLAGMQMPPMPAIAPDRADAPPNQQPIDFIAQNTYPKSDQPPISEANAKSQCPLAPNDGR